MTSHQELDADDAYALWAGHYPSHAHNPVMRAEERAMLSLLPHSLHGVRVLDVGCGSGRYLLHARTRGAQVVGVDRSAQMLNRARTHDLPVVRGSVTRLPIITGWADIVICALTLGHVRDLRRALSELARVLPLAGTVLCSDFHPMAAALGWKRSFRIDAQRYAVRYVTHHYADWHAAARSAGLRIDAVMEPRLDPADIEVGQRFDPQALVVPVALAFRMTRL